MYTTFSLKLSGFRESPSVTEYKTKGNTIAVLQGIKLDKLLPQYTDNGIIDGTGLADEWFKDIQKPHLQKQYNRIHKKYGYVDKKLFAKVIFNTLEDIKKLSFFDCSQDYRFIKREYKYLDTIQKIALAYEISKTFRKTKQA